MTEQERKDKLNEAIEKFQENARKYHNGELSFEEFHFVQRFALLDVKYYERVLTHD